MMLPLKIFKKPQPHAFCDVPTAFRSHAESVAHKAAALLHKWVVGSQWQLLLTPSHTFFPIAHMGVVSTNIHYVCNYLCISMLINNITCALICSFLYVQYFMFIHALGGANAYVSICDAIRLLTLFHPATDGIPHPSGV